MLFDKKKVKSKNNQISKGNNSIFIQRKNIQKAISKEMISSKLSYINDNKNLKSKNIENEEYGYELDQSSENNSKDDQEKNNIIVSSLLNEKSNGENVEKFENNSQNNKKEFIFLPMAKISLNKKIKNKRNENKEINTKIKKNKKDDMDNNILYKSLNTNGFINNKIILNKLNEMDNNYNNSKINFDGISAVSKHNSFENNYNENSNSLENNFFNSPKISTNTLFKSENLDINKNINYNSFNIFKENQNLKNIIKEKFIAKNNNFKAINIIKINDYTDKALNKDIKNNLDSNIIDKITKEKKELEEKLEKEKKLNKEKNNYIDILKNAINDNILENKNIIINNDNKKKEIYNVDLILEYSKYKQENEKIKKGLIMQNILIVDMKNELINLNNYNKKLEEEITQYKKNINNFKEKINEYEMKLTEKKSNEDELIINYNKQKSICYNLQREINTLKQKNNEINKEKCGENIEEKSLKDYSKILDEKKQIIKELKNDNYKLIKELDLNIQSLDNKNELIDIKKNIHEKAEFEQIENLNNILKSKELEIQKMKTNKNNYRIIIDSLYEKIKEITQIIQANNEIISEDYLNKANKILIKMFKEIIDHININNNGNILNDEKLKTIMEFNDILKRNLEDLFDKVNSIKNKFNKKKDIIINENKNNILNSNLFFSPNGLNNTENNNNPEKNNKNNNYNITRINNDNKKIAKNNKFKKIDIPMNLLNNQTSENKSINKYNNRFKITEPNFIKKKNILNNNKINLNSNLLEKNSIIYKSNLSPLNKACMASTSINKTINSKYNDLVNRMFDEDKNKTSSIKLSLKVKELSDLIINNHNSNQSFQKNNGNNLMIKNIKKSHNKLSEEESDKINNTINIYPSNSKTVDRNNENKMFSLTNLTTVRRNIKNKLDENNIFIKNTIEGKNNKNRNLAFLNYPLMINIPLNNHKKTISSSNNYLNKNLEIGNFPKLNIKNNDKKNNILLGGNFYCNNTKSEKANTLSLESNRVNESLNKKKEKFYIKLGNNSTSFFDSLRNNNYRNNRKKLSQKIIKPQLFEIDKNNTFDINGLAKEIMKPTFLKNDVSIKVNNNKEKIQDDLMFNEINKNISLNN